MTVAIAIYGLGLDPTTDPPGTCTTWTVRVTEIGTPGVIVYPAFSWAEVEARVRKVLAEHDIPADPQNLLEAMTLHQTRDG